MRVFERFFACFQTRGHLHTDTATENESVISTVHWEDELICISAAGGTF